MSRILEYGDSPDAAAFNAINPPRLTAAERRDVAQKLAAAVLWQVEFAARGDVRAAQNELDEAARLARLLLEPNGTALYDRLQENRHATAWEPKRDRVLLAHEPAVESMRGDNRQRGQRWCDEHRRAEYAD